MSKVADMAAKLNEARGKYHKAVAEQRNEFKKQIDDMKHQNRVSRDKKDAAHKKDRIQADRAAQKHISNTEEEARNIVNKARKKYSQALEGLKENFHEERVKDQMRFDRKMDLAQEDFRKTNEKISSSAKDIQEIQREKFKKNRDFINRAHSEDVHEIHDTHRAQLNQINNDFMTKKDDMATKFNRRLDDQLQNDARRYIVDTRELKDQIQDLRDAKLIRDNFNSKLKEKNAAAIEKSRKDSIKVEREFDRITRAARNQIQKKANIFADRINDQKREAYKNFEEYRLNKDEELRVLNDRFRRASDTKDKNYEKFRDNLITNTRKKLEGREKEHQMALNDSYKTFKAANKKRSGQARSKLREMAREHAQDISSLKKAETDKRLQDREKLQDQIRIIKDSNEKNMAASNNSHLSTIKNIRAQHSHAAQDTYEKFEQYAKDLQADQKLREKGLKKQYREFQRSEAEAHKDEIQKLKRKLNNLYEYSAGEGGEMSRALKAQERVNNTRLNKLKVAHAQEKRDYDNFIESQRSPAEESLYHARQNMIKALGKKDQVYTKILRDQMESSGNRQIKLTDAYKSKLNAQEKFYSTKLNEDNDKAKKAMERQTAYYNEVFKEMSDDNIENFKLLKKNFDKEKKESIEKMTESHSDLLNRTRKNLIDKIDAQDELLQDTKAANSLAIKKQKSKHMDTIKDLQNTLVDQNSALHGQLVTQSNLNAKEMKAAIRDQQNKAHEQMREVRLRAEKKLNDTKNLNQKQVKKLIKTHNREMQSILLDHKNQLFNERMAHKNQFDTMVQNFRQQLDYMKTQYESKLSRQQTIMDAKISDLEEKVEYVQTPDSKKLA